MTTRSSLKRRQTVDYSEVEALPEPDMQQFEPLVYFAARQAAEARVAALEAEIRRLRGQ